MSDLYDDLNGDNKRKKIYMGIIAGVVVVICAALIIFFLFFKKDPKQTSGDSSVEETTTQQETMRIETQPTTMATQPSTAETQATVATQVDSLFNAVNDKVTAKETTNLRDSYYDSSNIVATLSYGEYVQRTGISDYGWSRLVYNGQIVYAKTQLLLGEGESKATTATWRDEYNMTYQDVNEQVTPKDETNLRAVPSTSDDSTIVVTIKKGTYVTRIGIGDKGWSKINYNGQILYAVTNYLTK